MARQFQSIALSDPAVELSAAEDADRCAVARTCAGHPQAFEEIVRRHASGLQSLCSRLLRDGRLGEELAQETFAKAFSRLDTFRGQGTVRHWLYRIAANGCRDLLRSGRTQGAVELLEEEPATTVDPERDAVARQSVQALALAVARLPPACRQAFVLFHLEELSYEQISALTGVQVNALKVRVHRAREMLRRRLAEVV